MDAPVADGLTPEALRDLQARLTPAGQKLLADLLRQVAAGARTADLFAVAARNLGMRPDELQRALQDPRQFQRLASDLLADAGQDAAALRALLARAGIKTSPR